MVDTQREVLFLLGSTRTGGNTEALARQATRALPATVGQRWLRLSELALPPFVDHRHDGTQLPEPTGNERLLLDATLAATDLVFASPLYWYSVSAETKRYLDYWSGWLRLPGVDWKARMAGKRFWSVTAYSDESETVVEPLLGTLRLSAEYLRADWGGSLVWAANRPGDVTGDPAALAAADRFGAELARPTPLLVG